MRQAMMSIRPTLELTALIQKKLGGGGGGGGGGI